MIKIAKLLIFLFFTLTLSEITSSVPEDVPESESTEISTFLNQILDFDVSKEDLTMTFRNFISDLALEPIKVRNLEEALTIIAKDTFFKQANELGDNLDEKAEAIIQNYYNKVISPEAVVGVLLQEVVQELIITNKASLYSQLNQYKTDNSVDISMPSYVSSFLMKTKTNKSNLPSEIDKKVLALIKSNEEDWQSEENRINDLIFDNGFLFVSPEDGMTRILSRLIDEGKLNLEFAVEYRSRISAVSYALAARSEMLPKNSVYVGNLMAITKNEAVRFQKHLKSQFEGLEVANFNQLKKFYLVVLKDLFVNLSIFHHTEEVFTVMKNFFNGLIGKFENNHIQFCYNNYFVDIFDSLKKMNLRKDNINMYKMFLPSFIVNSSQSVSPYVQYDFILHFDVWGDLTKDQVYWLNKVNEYLTMTPAILFEENSLIAIQYMEKLMKFLGDSDLSALTHENFFLEFDKFMTVNLNYVAIADAKWSVVIRLINFVKSNGLMKSVSVSFFKDYEEYLIQELSDSSYQNLLEFYKTIILREMSNEHNDLQTEYNNLYSITDVSGLDKDVKLAKLIKRMEATETEINTGFTNDEVAKKMSKLICNSYTFKAQQSKLII
jgi:hypothetical protein